MTQRSSSILSAFTAIQLGLTSLSFLLIPSRQQELLATMQLPLIYVLGSLFYLGALACAMSIVIPTPHLQVQIIRVISIVMLGMLLALYLRAGFVMEAVLILNAIIAQLAFIIWKYRKSSEHYGISRTSIIAINLLSASLLAFRNIPQNHAYEILGSMRAVLIFMFLITALTSALLFLEKLKFNPFLRLLPALPWLAWCYIFFRTPSTPNLIPPIAIAVVILFGDVLPWRRLVLPQGDIIGRRTIMVGSLTHAITLGFITGLLFVLDKSFKANQINVELIPIREFAFYLIIAISGITFYGLLSTILTINGLAELSSLNRGESASSQDTGLVSWNKRVARYLRPFSSHGNLHNRLGLQEDQINLLSQKLTQEKKRNLQLTLLSELSQQLETQLDQPVAAQLTVSTLERAVECDVACLYTHEPERREFVAFAFAGRNANVIPPGYRQSITRGIIGRAARQRKTQVVNDIQHDPDYFSLESEKSLSTIVVPIIFNGHIQGIIELSSEKANAFSSIDVALTETVAAELARSWERSSYYERLTNLIEAGVSLSSMTDPQAAVQEIAAIARQVLQARFIYVKIHPAKDDSYTHIASSGYAPRLMQSLEREEEKTQDTFLKSAVNSLQPFRVRDTRKYAGTSLLDIDHASLRSLLVIPIRLYRLSIGTILAFGKQGEVFFTENDESLARLLSIQAAGAFESTWLQQELRNSLIATSLLYQLSNHIIQTEELHDAALFIAQTSYKLVKDSATGIVLFTPDGRVEAEVEFDQTGAHSGTNHPIELINQVLKTGEVIYKSDDQLRTHICLPIQTSLRKYGVLWIHAPEDSRTNPSNPADLQTLANQAALALERSRLLVEWRHQAEELKVAYNELELAYDRTLAGLISSLDARDRETEGHSLRVSQVAVKLGKMVGLSASQSKALERGSLLHDIGKIGVSDNILHKPGPLIEEEWEAMRLHPDIGARIVEGIPFLQETIPVIRYHQERWDGSGYPLGLSGKDIPLLARIFATVDIFDALVSNRPYRTKVSIEDALEYLRGQAGILLDPEIVEIFIQLVKDEKLDDVQLTE
jgi:HD-GYP domain-containing protein (c-di-GMP phosphodiesterase class II)/putative methionine-R-sulfoxide reductase with GAF domain